MWRSPRSSALFCCHSVLGYYEEKLITYDQASTSRASETPLGRFGIPGEDGHGCRPEKARYLERQAAKCESVFYV
jgi:hypothetical protein